MIKILLLFGFVLFGAVCFFFGVCYGGYLISSKRLEEILPRQQPPIQQIKIKTTERSTSKNTIPAPSPPILKKKKSGSDIEEKLKKEKKEKKQKLKIKTKPRARIQDLKDVVVVQPINTRDYEEENIPYLDA